MKRKEIGWTAADWYQRHIELQESEKYPQHESPRPKLQILKENIHQRRLHHGSRQVLDAANELDNSLKICQLIESAHVPDNVKVLIHKKVIGKSPEDAQLIIEVLEKTVLASQKLHRPTPVQPRPTYHAQPDDAQIANSFCKLNRR